jgi:hypothetical protein
MRIRNVLTTSGGGSSLDIRTVQEFLGHGDGLATRPACMIGETAYHDVNGLTLVQGISRVKLAKQNAWQYRLQAGG